MSIFLLHILAVIGGFAVLAFFVLVAWAILQLTTDDNIKPRKPWWWRF